MYMNRFFVFYACIVLFAAPSYGQEQEWKEFPAIKDPPPFGDGWFKDFSPFRPMSDFRLSIEDQRVELDAEPAFRPFKPMKPLKVDPRPLEMDDFQVGPFRSFKPMERLGPHPIEKYRLNQPRQ